MKVCPNCHSQVSDTTKFYPECGNQFSISQSSMKKQEIEKMHQEATAHAVEDLECKEEEFKNTADSLDPLHFAPHCIDVEPLWLPCPTCGGASHGNWKVICVDLDREGRLEGIRIQCQVCYKTISLHGRQSVRYRRFVKLINCDIVT